MPSVTKIYGPPGTGKTEKLIRRAMAYNDRDWETEIVLPSHI